MGKYAFNLFIDPIIQQTPMMYIEPNQNNVQPVQPHLGVPINPGYQVQQPVPQCKNSNLKLFSICPCWS